ncbi:MAG: MiaB/RimO family radical SAM methylthiotransferase [Pirellulales bacterium]|nr:MiaB/RimO family radical SAM methylthiotransferase [Pirellulales bacterium]
MPHRVYIQTVGCQMNVLDSELAAADLMQVGYELVHSPREADTILYNTCSVRQHAEDKIYSALGRLKPLKQKRPDLIIGVMGCMAQKDRDAIFRRAPHVDLVVGPGQLGRLPEFIDRVRRGDNLSPLPTDFGPAPGGEPVARAVFQPSKLLEIGLDRASGRRKDISESFKTFNVNRTAAMRSVPHQALVRIAFGCDRFCAYCVVPRVRGPEQNRPAAEIEEEVRRLADGGCLEITLLGQTVNGYRDDSGGATVRLSDLLHRLHEIAGIRRLKFVTNHPNYMTDDLLAAMRDLPKVSPYLHVPAQSGANEILRRMKRGYTVEQYREMLERIREKIPQAAVASDFIVGFCGETEEEFQQTVELVRTARFKNSFIFKYSSRPGTKAAELYADDISEEVKRRRNNELLAVQNAICLEDNQPYLGRTVEILVEGPSKVARKQPPGAATVQLVGRTVHDRIVVFDGPRELIGKIIEVTIEKLDPFTLFGKLL